MNREMVKIVVLDWTDPALLPRECADLRKRAEASRSGYCGACRAVLTVRDDGHLIFRHHPLCPCSDRRSAHISKRVQGIHGRVPRSILIFGDPSVWRPIVAGRKGVIFVEERA